MVIEMKLLIFLSFLLGSCFSEEKKFETVDFLHETCQLETLSGNVFKMFYPAKQFYNANGVLELLVRFKGIADGHITLTGNMSDAEPRYMITLGSYNNKMSEIRKLQPTKIEFKMNTPGILSDRQYRGFLIRYNPKGGGIWVFAEGSDMPLLHLVDPAPLTIKYFSFATWVNRVVQVAFNCQAKDSRSSFVQRRMNTQIRMIKNIFITTLVLNCNVLRFEIKLLFNVLKIQVSKFKLSLRSN